MKQSIVLTLILLFGGLPSIVSAQTSPSSSSPAVADGASSQPATGGTTLDTLIGELERAAEWAGRIAAAG